jgi:hypothetical protein
VFVVHWYNSMKQAWENMTVWLAGSTARTNIGRGWDTNARTSYGILVSDISLGLKLTTRVIVGLWWLLSKRSEIHFVADAPASLRERQSDSVGRMICRRGDTRPREVFRKLDYTTKDGIDVPGVRWAKVPHCDDALDIDADEPPVVEDVQEEDRLGHSGRLQTPRRSFSRSRPSMRNRKVCRSDVLDVVLEQDRARIRAPFDWKRQGMQLAEQ